MYKERSDTLRVRDFHTHTTLSDGVLSPIELIRRAIVVGYASVGISDHSGRGTLERIIREVVDDCRLAYEHWGFVALPGVELTHVPASSIAELAARAKELGAAYVVVHGESPVEPVEPGTNLAAARCPDVDIIAHPGLIDRATVEAAADNGVFVEISAKAGHSLGNGRVARIAAEGGAKLILGSDSHTPEQLLSADFAMLVLRCAGLDESEARRVMIENAEELLARCVKRVEWL